MSTDADVALDRSPLLTLNGVAEWLAVSPDSIYRMIRSGALPAIRIGGQWRFRQVDVDRFLDEHTVEQWTRSNNRLP